jgi:Listeria/Bacterioides repeat
MRKVNIFLTAIFLIATTTLTAQTDTLVRMKSNANEVYLYFQWTPSTAVVKANGVPLKNWDFATYKTDTISVNEDSTVFITSEDSVALTRLSCYNSQLNQLDVSNNTALTTLGCGANYLSQLDVTNNTALTTLNCNCNQLSQLNVSNNTALMALDCSGNQLSQLNVTNNTALTELDCDGNQLSQLDVTNNTVLMKLHCNFNYLSQLDVTNNTALELLWCFDNQLSQLELPNSTALIQLMCLSNQLSQLDVANNTALRELDCNSNQLNQLDVTNNTALILLNCHHNQLNQLDVTNNAALQFLACSDNYLSSLDLSKNQQLMYLEAPNQAIEVPQADDIATFSNPIYYHKKTAVEQVKISGKAYAYKENVPMPIGKDTLHFTTNSTVFSGVITFVQGVAVIFNTNGGTDVEPMAVKQGGVIGAISCTREGYTLEGWYTDEDFTPSKKWNLVTDVVNKSMELHAQWAPNTGISEATHTAINIYPNPAQHTLYITSAETVEHVSIYDISGRTVGAYSIRPYSPSPNIDISNLANGIYLVKVKTTQGESIRKIVISD